MRKIPCSLALLCVELLWSSPAFAQLTLTRIAFHSNRDTGISRFQIYSVSPDGTNLARLTNNSANEGGACWSPDGSKIAFSSDRDGNSEIYVMNSDGTNQTRITNNPGNDGPSSWSPDGSKIAFSSDRDGNSEIYTMNADGTNQVRLTNNSVVDQSPIWSPDGSKIAFSSDRDGNSEIYVMNSDGTNQTRLTNNTKRDWLGSWSPDGTKIVFESDTQIHAMNADGTNQWQLYVIGAQEGSPSWSPDGSKIALLSDRNHKDVYDLFVMNSDGSNQSLILSSTPPSITLYTPAWSPLPPAMSVTLGNNQTGATSASLSGPLILTVKNMYGFPASGITVTFAIDSIPNGAAGQRLSVAGATTDANGQASTVLTLGDKAGTYRVSATSAGLRGIPVIFRATALSPPTVTTTAASAITRTSATLNGSVNPNGQATTAYFEWGTSSTLSTFDTTTSQSIGSGTSAVSVTANLTGLNANTTYYYRAVGQNSGGTQNGSIVSFTTSALPTVTTSAGSNIGSTSATLNGSVNPNGSTATAWFEWGTSGILSTYTSTASQSIGSGTSAVSVTANLTGLSASTTYYYRVVGQNSAGTSGGSIVSFTTLSGAVPNPPTLSSPPDGAANQNTRPALSWTASAGATNYHLQVSQSSSFSTTVFDDTTITTTSRQVGPLQNNRTLYWRVRAKSTSGWSEYSTAFSFGTLPPPAFSTASVRSSFVSPGSLPTGLAWDGTNLWMIDNLKNVYKMDTSGTVLSSFTAPRFPDLDLSWDGTGLWIGGGQGYGSGRNMKVDALGNRVDSLDVSHWALSGFEWDGKFFWISDYNSSLIYKHARNGTPLLNFGVDVSTARPNSISYDGVNLWIGSPGNNVSKYSTSGQFLYRANLNALGITSTAFSVVAWDGQSLWIAKTDQFTIYRLNVPYYHTPPAAPVLVSPADGATGQPLSVTFGWQPSLEAATYRVQVSTSSSFTSTVFNDSTVTGTSVTVTGLSGGTTYYWRVNAKNAGGTSAYSTTWSFTTSAAVTAPTVSTSAATNVTATSAALNGTVNPNGSSTTAYFEWGTSSTLSSSSTTTSQSIGSSTSAVSVTASLTGLSPSTTYYYRAVGQNSAGTQRASILSFTTSAAVPTVVTFADFSPKSGPIGTTVTITGSNFSTIPPNNIVYFGAVRATVSSATSTSLTVTVPVGATYAPITVTDLTTGLIAYSAKPFTVTFADGGSISSSSFAAKVDFTTGIGPPDLAIADLDGDGKPDLAVTNMEGNTVSLFRNTSTSGSITSGSFAGKVDFTTGTNPYMVAIGDLDGDGKPDLAVTNVNSNTVSVFRNTSTTGLITSGSFAAKVDFTTGYWPRDVAIGDLDSDGKPDLAVTNANSNTVSLFRNTSTSGSITSGSFAAKVDFTTGSGPDGVAIGDLDGDGKPDLAITNGGSNTVSVLRNVMGPLAFLGEYTPDANTVLLLHMNETSGTTVSDASGNGNNGTATGTTVVDGRFGKARSYSTTGEIVTIPHSTSLNFGTGAYTLEAWVNTLNLTNLGGHPCFKVSSGRGWQTELESNGNVSFSVEGDQGRTGLTSVRQINDDKWHHIAGVVTQTTLRLYIDGVLDSSVPVTTLGSLDNNGNLNIGLSSGITPNPFKGLIDEVRISNKARSPDEFNLQLPPKNLSATGSAAAISLSWQNGGGAAPLLRYTIYRGADSTTVILIDSTTSTSFSDSKVTAGTRYFYRIGAVDISGFEGVRSYAATALAASAPTAASNAATSVAATTATINGTVNPNGLATTVAFEWGTSSSLSSYSTTSSQSVGAGGSPVAVKADLTGLTASTTYYFRVMGQNSLGTQRGLILSFTTLPSAVVLSSPADGATNQSTTLTLSWNTSPGATRYRLQLSTSSSFSPLLVDDTTLTTTSRQVGPLAYSTTYYWRVSATSAGGTSPFSQTFSFSTVPSPPTTLALSASVTFPVKAKASEYEATEYRIVGLPGTSDLPVNSLFSGTRNVDWQAYWDNGTATNYLVEFDGSSTFRFSLGRAFWVIARGALNINRIVNAPQLNSALEAELSLNTGWNLITNPFSSTISWSKIQSTNGTNAPIYTFNGSFSTSSNFDPYVGYYFFNGSPNTTLTKLRVPYAGIFTKASEPIEVTAGGWRINVAFSAGDIIDAEAWLGVSNLAKDGLDLLDTRKPRGLPDLATVYFERPEWDNDFSAFASDIRSEIDEFKTWNFSTVGDLGKPASLAFRGISSVPQQYVVYLIDVERARTMDLRRDSVYSFVPQMKVSHFRVLVGTPAAVEGQVVEIMPKEFSLSQNFPNPFNPSTTISVSLPAPSEVRISVFNTLGQETRSLFAGWLEAGRHWFTWDGRNELGVAMPSGAYYCRLGAPSGRSFVTKMILIR